MQDGQNDKRTGPKVPDLDVTLRQVAKSIAETPVPPEMLDLARRLQARIDAAEPPETPPEDPETP